MIINKIHQKIISDLKLFSNISRKVGDLAENGESPKRCHGESPWRGGTLSPNRHGAAEKFFSANQPRDHPANTE